MTSLFCFATAPMYLFSHNVILHTYFIYHICISGGWECFFWRNFATTSSNRIFSNYLPFSRTYIRRYNF